MNGERIEPEDTDEASAAVAAAPDADEAADEHPEPDSRMTPEPPS